MTKIIDQKLANFAARLQPKILEPYKQFVENSLGDYEDFIENFFHLLNDYFKISGDKLEALIRMSIMMINSVLLLEDTQNEAHFQRGTNKPAVNRRFSTGLCLNAATEIFYKAIDELESEFSDGEMFEIAKFALKFSAISHQGRSQEIEWRDLSQPPTEEKYIKMIKLKMGSFLQMAFEILSQISDNQKNLGKLQNDSKIINEIIDLLAIHLQISQDVENFSSGMILNQGGLCKDLVEGKFSFPVICAFEHYGEDKALQKLLLQRSTDSELQKYALRLIEESGALSYSANKLIQMKRQIQDLVSEMEQKIDFTILIK